MTKAQSSADVILFMFSIFKNLFIWGAVHCRYSPFPSAKEIKIFDTNKLVSRKNRDTNDESYQNKKENAGIL